MKPMLAATVKNVEALRFPLMASPKLDGVRAIVRNGCVLSRSFKPIPNQAVQEKFKDYDGLDGELIVGDPAATDVYRKTVSKVMTIIGDAEGVSFQVFDNVTLLNSPFCERHAKIPPALALPQTVCRAVNEVLAIEQQYLAQGYEGIILRDPLGAYKHGRSTLNEQGMLKLKRFSDDEGVVVGMEELMHNANPAFTNELGHTAHTSHQANQVPRDTLGALVVQWRGTQFKIGTGFTDAERKWIWETAPLGRIVKFKYLQVGMKDLPRHPVFLGWRSEIDK